MTPKPHEINITARLDKEKGKWKIRVTGVTSGAKIHLGDELSIEFGLDASRFTPVITQGKTS